MEPARPSRFLSFPVVLSIDLETHLPSTSQLTSEPDAPPSATNIPVSYVVSRQIEVPKGFRIANQGLPDRRGSANQILC